LPSDASGPGQFWARALFVMAAARVIVGFIGVVLRPEMLARTDALPLPGWTYLVLVLVFAAPAWFLWSEGRRDPRARYLGLVYLLIASAFAKLLLVEGWEASPAPLPLLSRRFESFALDAFLPYWLWRFAAEFPRAPLLGRATRVQRWMTRGSLVVAVVLFAANLVTGFDLDRAGWMSALDSTEPRSLYQAVIFLPVVGALAFIVWKSRRAASDERRRGRLFLAGLILGSVPISVEILLEVVVPPFGRLMQAPSARAAVGSVLLPLLFSVPLTTTWSVLVHRALDVRLVVRRALQYALARYTILLAIALPFVAFAALLLLNRRRALAEVATGGTALTLLATAGVAALAYRVRQPALDAVDRRFYREQYDARRILSDLVERARPAHTEAELAELLCVEIDRALHLGSALALFLDPLTGVYRAPGRRHGRLERTSPLIRLAAVERRPFEIDLERPSAEVRRLAEAERNWLVDTGARLIVPLTGSNGDLLGLLALGEKRSELPWSKSDLELLAGVAASGALVLENRLLRSSAGASGGRRAAGLSAEPKPSLSLGECERCGTIRGVEAGDCPRCGERLTLCPLPAVLAGKYRVERRLGRGGMGVVYLAHDETLDRPVAIKTLPTVSASRAVRLRREARAMAAIRHPNLALIYAVEAWHGTPLLILEYLGGGTLADRIARGALPIDEAVGIARILCAVVERTHRAGVLHRDIKPTNIGFDDDGTLKLLDFGLAHLFAETDLGHDGGSSPASDTTAVGLGSEAPTATVLTRTTRGYLVGTPLYMSPEAALCRRPDPTFDLWAVAIVLYEALAGRHPLTLDPGFSLERVVRADIPNVRELRADCPDGLAGFLSQALSLDRSERPGSARDFARRLQQALPMD
jgi:GAF domain-containing protein